jgi:hypothetical protein
VDVSDRAKLALDSAVAHSSRRWRGAVGRFRGLATARRTLTQFAFFLQREVQPLRKTSECEGSTPERRVLFGQPGEFLATTRTVISHNYSPFRSARTFERDDIHTGHNECRQRTVLVDGILTPRRGSIAGDGACVCRGEMYQ